MECDADAAYEEVDIPLDELYEIAGDDVDLESVFVDTSGIAGTYLEDAPAAESQPDVDYSEFTEAVQVDEMPVAMDALDAIAEADVIEADVGPDSLDGQGEAIEMECLEDNVEDAATFFMDVAGVYDLDVTATEPLEQRVQLESNCVTEAETPQEQECAARVDLIHDVDLEPVDDLDPADEYQLRESCSQSVEADVRIDEQGLQPPEAAVYDAQLSDQPVEIDVYDVQHDDQQIEADVGVMQPATFSWLQGDAEADLETEVFDPGEETAPVDEPLAASSDPFEVSAEVDEQGFVALQPDSSQEAPTATRNADPADEDDEDVFFIDTSGGDSAPPPLGVADSLVDASAADSAPEQLPLIDAPAESGEEFVEEELVLDDADIDAMAEDSFIAEATGQTTDALAGFFDGSNNMFSLPTGNSVATESETRPAPIQPPVPPTAKIPAPKAAGVYWPAMPRIPRPPMSPPPNVGTNSLGPSGYLFLCGGRTQSECEKLRMFGSPMRDLVKMQKHITQDTNIFLLNYDTLKLMGTFVAYLLPRKDIIPGAYGGKYPAQVGVMPIDGPLRETQLEARIPPGPKTPQEVKILRKALTEGGRLCRSQMQKAWGADLLGDPEDSHTDNDSADSNAAGSAGDGPFSRVSSFASTADESPDEMEELELAPPSPGYCAPSPKYAPPSSAPSAKYGSVAAVATPKGVNATPQGGVVAKFMAGMKRNLGRSAPNNKPTPKNAIGSPAPPVPAVTPLKTLASQAKPKPPAGAPPFWPKASAHAAQGPETGYVFYCNTSTMHECQRLKLFGSPEKEMSQMKQCITQNTKLFLCNFESLRLLGPFCPTGPPAANVIKGAFNSRFSAQVRVATIDDVPLMEAKLDRKVPAGPKNKQGVNVLMEMLRKGDKAIPSVQKTWGALAGKGNEVKWSSASSSVAKPPIGKAPGGAIGKGAAAKRSSPGGLNGMQPAAKRSKFDHLRAAVDKEGREYNLGLVVVNFANVGATYATKVLRKGKAQGDRLFDWEGVRKCVQYITKELEMQVVGCIYENYWGPDGDVQQVHGVPEDIRCMCLSIQETPRLTGRNHKSADDEMTIKLAYRRNCRFMDNDNYRDWLSELRDARVRDWLENCQDLLQMRYFFDTDLGTFDTIDGNIPVGLLAVQAA